MNCRIGQSFTLQALEPSRFSQGMQIEVKKSDCELCQVYSNCYYGYPFLKCEKGIRVEGVKNWWWTFDVLKRVF